MDSSSSPLSRAVKSWEAARVALSSCRDAIIALAAHVNIVLPVTVSQAGTLAAPLVEQATGTLTGPIKPNAVHQQPSSAAPQPQNQQNAPQQPNQGKRKRRGKKNKNKEKPPPPTPEELVERRLARNAGRSARKRERRLANEAAGILPPTKVRQQKLPNVPSALHGTHANTVPLAFNRLAPNGLAPTDSDTTPALSAGVNPGPDVGSTNPWNMNQVHNANNRQVFPLGRGTVQNSAVGQGVQYDRAWQIAYDSAFPAIGTQTSFAAGYTPQQPFIAQSASGFGELVRQMNREPVQLFGPYNNAPQHIDLTPIFPSYPQIPIHGQPSAFSQYGLVSPQFIYGGKEWERNGSIVAEPALDDHDIHSVADTISEPGNEPIDDLINTYATLPASRDNHHSYYTKDVKLPTVIEETIEEGEARETTEGMQLHHKMNAVQEEGEILEKYDDEGRAELQDVSMMDIDTIEAGLDTMEENYVSTHTRSHNQSTAIESPVASALNPSAPAFDFERKPLAPQQIRNLQAKTKGIATRNQVGYKDGDIVGEAAPVLDENNKGRLMMLKLGWQDGKGLGVSPNKGMLEPIAPVIKTTKSGLR